MASSTRASGTSSAAREATLGPVRLARSTEGASEWQRAWRQFRRHRMAMLSLGGLAILVALAALAPWLTPYDRDRTSLRDRFKPPSAEHWMGTDELGRDVWTRVLYGGRVSLGAGVLVAVLSVLLGGLVGTASAYAGGLVDEVLMRAVDIIRALPLLAVLIVLAQVLRAQLGVRGGFWGTVIILVAFSWTSVARIVRGVVLSVKEQDFIVAARGLGVPGYRIVLRHLLPSAAGPMIVAASLGAGAAINAESALSFLGLGIQPPTPSWGNLLFNAQTYLWNQPWIAIFPGVFILLTLLFLNFVGDGLRDALDPRFRSG
jgi:peptide/nickel transport system permease protein